MDKIAFNDLRSQYETIKDEIDQAILEVIEKSAFIGGHYVQTFEDAFAKFCNVDYCKGVANGTDALYIALRALGIGEGDEVITVANSFIATSEAITLAGAKVKFVDINPVTYNIDVSKIEEKITNKTRAIIPVHLHGQPAEMDSIISLAQKYNLKIVEDAAQAHGAIYKNRNTGTLGDLATFSFYPCKNLGAFGDGGAIVTNDADLAVKVGKIANHGRTSKYDHMMEGVNSRLDGLQAAILKVKLGYLAKWTERRREIAYLYNDLLKDTELVLPSEIADVYAVYHLYVVRIKSELRDKFQNYLKENGIATGIHYPIALPFLEAYSYLNHSEDDFPQALKASKEIVSLPIYPDLEDSQVAYIAEKIKEFQFS